MVVLSEVTVERPKYTEPEYTLYENTRLFATCERCERRIGAGKRKPKANIFFLKFEVIRSRSRSEVWTSDDNAYPAEDIEYRFKIVGERVRDSCEADVQLQTAFCFVPGPENIYRNKGYCTCPLANSSLFVLVDMYRKVEVDQHTLAQPRRSARVRLEHQVSGAYVPMYDLTVVEACHQS